MEYPSNAATHATRRVFAACRSETDADPQIAVLRDIVEARLPALLPLPRDANDCVALAVRAAVLSPGKRLRPLLMLAAVRSLRLDPLPFADVACALELVHAASLALDDLPCMDDAVTRRGRPALHRQYGEDIAVLAALSLLSLAYRIVAAAPSVKPSTRARMVVALADAAGVHGLVHGQLRDLHPATQGTDASQAVDTNHLKTGALMGAAFEFAALAADADSVLAQELDVCAWHVGQAFQLLDDLKDQQLVPGDGKNPGQDAGKPTLLALLNEPAARVVLASHLRAVDELLHRTFQGNDCLPTLVRQMFSAVAECLPVAGAGDRGPKVNAGANAGHAG